MDGCTQGGHLVGWLNAHAHVTPLSSLIFDSFLIISWCVVCGFCVALRNKCHVFRYDSEQSEQYVYLSMCARVCPQKSLCLQWRWNAMGWTQSWLVHKYVLMSSEHSYTLTSTQSLQWSRVCTFKRASQHRNKN